MFTIVLNQSPSGNGFRCVLYVCELQQHMGDTLLSAFGTDPIVLRMCICRHTYMYVLVSYVHGFVHISMYVHVAGTVGTVLIGEAS